MSAQLTVLIDTITGKVLGYGIYGPNPRRPFAGGKCDPGHVQAVIDTTDLGGTFIEDQDEMARVMLRQPRYAHIIAFMRADDGWRWDDDPEPGLYECSFKNGAGGVRTRMYGVYGAEGPRMLHFEDGSIHAWEDFADGVTEMRRCTVPAGAGPDGVVPF